MTSTSKSAGSTNWPSPSSRPDRAIADPTTVGVAVYDASCLFAKHTRYLLLGLAVHGVVRARWSARLLEETAASLAGKLRGDSLEDLGRWIKTETDLVRDGLVTGYEHWIPDLALPDAGDNHVLAAAIESGATTIVTSNIRDFPIGALEPYGIVAKDPDSFLLECIDANPVLAARLVTDAPTPTPPRHARPSHPQHRNPATRPAQLNEASATSRSPLTRRRLSSRK